MKRLRDEEAAPGTTERHAIDLLRATEPLQVSPFARARVRAALGRERAARAPWLLRPATIVAFLLAGVTVAGAALGPRLLARRAATPAPAPAAAKAPVAPVVEAVELPVAAPVVEQAPEPRARPARHVAAKAPTPVAAVEAPAAPTPTDDPTLVATALRALRREHDAARAGALVDEYLRRWPSGALTEEAMALAVEAAAARHDARTATLATRYLARFPNGRFRDVVAAARAAAAAP
jgi:hypothetical protein